MGRYGEHGKNHSQHQKGGQNAFSHGNSPAFLGNDIK
jgi:hypothetical protein